MEEPTGLYDSLPRPKTRKRTGPLKKGYSVTRKVPARRRAVKAGMKGGNNKLKLEDLKHTVSKVMNDHGDNYTKIGNLKSRAEKLGVNVREVKTIDDLYGKLKDAGVGRF